METTKISKFQEKAQALSAAFEGATRDDGVNYRRLKDGSPEWMRDAILAAHGDMFADDWRYAFCEEAADALMDADDPDDAEIEADIYTHDLTGWLHSLAGRAGYCFAEEFGAARLPEGGLIGLLQGGQYAEKRETLDMLRAALEALVDAEGRGEG